MKADVYTDEDAPGEKVKFKSSFISMFEIKAEFCVISLEIWSDIFLLILSYLASVYYALALLRSLFTSCSPSVYFACKLHKSKSLLILMIRMTFQLHLTKIHSCLLQLRRTRCF